MIIEYSNDHSGVQQYRLLYGLKKNGRNYFENDNAHKIIEIETSENVTGRYEARNIFVSLENDANKENDNRDNQNQSFMQRTKSWMSNIWTNVKNYNYRNILRKTEMEDVLDAHGNHIKLPKNRKEKILQKKKNNGESNLKYGDINYNTYYISSNVNVFYGYPF